MVEESNSSRPRPSAREARLAEALRANLARRKARARSTDAGSPTPDTPPGPQPED